MKSQVWIVGVVWLVATSLATAESKPIAPKGDPRRGGVHGSGFQDSLHVEPGRERRLR